MPTTSDNTPEPVTELTDEQAEALGAKMKDWLWKLHADRAQLRRALGPDVSLEIILPEKWAPEGWTGEIGRCFRIPCYVGNVFSPVCRPKAHDWRFYGRRAYFDIDGEFTPAEGTHVGRVEWRDATVRSSEDLRTALEMLHYIPRLSVGRIRPLPSHNVFGPRGDVEPLGVSAGTHDSGGAMDVSPAVAEMWHETLLRMRSAALNRVAADNDILRAALLRVITAADVRQDTVDPTAVHDAIGSDLIHALLIGKGAPQKETLL